LQAGASEQFAAPGLCLNANRLVDWWLYLASFGHLVCERERRCAGSILSLHIVILVTGRPGPRNETVHLVGNDLVILDAKVMTDISCRLFQSPSELRHDPLPVCSFHYFTEGFGGTPV
jgi:hypothetical protein